MFRWLLLGSVAVSVFQSQVALSEAKAAGLADDSGLMAEARSL